MEGLGSRGLVIQMMETGSVMWPRCESEQEIISVPGPRRKRGEVNDIFRDRGPHSQRDCGTIHKRRAGTQTLFKAEREVEGCP